MRVAWEEFNGFEYLMAQESTSSYSRERWIVSSEDVAKAVKYLQKKRIEPLVVDVSSCSFDTVQNMNVEGVVVVNLGFENKHRSPYAKEILAKCLKIPIVFIEMPQISPNEARARYGEYLSKMVEKFEMKTNFEEQEGE